MTRLSRRLMEFVLLLAAAVAASSAAAGPQQLRARVGRVFIRRAAALPSPAAAVAWAALPPWLYYNASLGVVEGVPLRRHVGVHAVPALDATIEVHDGPLSGGGAGNASSAGCAWRQPTLAAAAAAPSAMTKSASARIVRFHCPYESVSSSDQDSTLVSPYLTSTFTCLLPLPPGGSVSSGYSSDRESPPDAAVSSSTTAAAAAAHWVTREEDIDCLLRRPAASGSAAAAAAATTAAIANATTMDSSVLSGDAFLPDDLDIEQLDVPAFFSGLYAAAPAASPVSCGSLLQRRHPQPLPQRHPQPLPPWLQHQLPQGRHHIYDPVAADEIDRLVSDVVRLGSGSSNSLAVAQQRQSWGSWQRPQHHQQLHQQVPQRRQQGWQELSSFATAGPPQPRHPHHSRATIGLQH